MSPDSNSPACSQCGAIGCREKYDEILALEFESPAVFGSVHHITVNCYNLQHPDIFTDEALAWMRTSLHAIVTEGLSGPELLKRARKTFKGDVPVKRRTPLTKASPRTKWSMTVMDIRTDSPEVYVKDIKAWAESILDDLKIA
jgi:hypothetical protein